MNQDFNFGRPYRRKIQQARRREDIETGLDLLYQIKDNSKSFVTPNNVFDDALSIQKFVNHLMVIAAKKGDYETTFNLIDQHGADAGTPYRNGKNLIHMTKIWSENEHDPVHKYQLKRISEELLRRQTPDNKRQKHLKRISCELVS